MGKQIDMGKQFHEEEKSQDFGIKQALSLLNPKKMQQMTQEMAEKSLENMQGKKMLIEQAQNGFVLTNTTNKKVLCKDLKEVIQLIEVYFKK